MPAVVTSDVAKVKAGMAELLAFYDQLPSYQRVVAAEGVSRAADLALVGDEETVAAGVRAYFDAGATEVLLAHTGVGSAADRRRTWTLAASA
ncbi:hypothetical protein [Fodinicola acaciae]|uniref:hypothetical protein n=1 Tax=Fodinicola acaciae TaxID=2681555 RepID=UPI001C9E9952|nr:hypothetical protein [Fodinicola acaciae]